MGRRVVIAQPLDACRPLEDPGNIDAEAMKFYEGKAVVVSRGSCLFLQKLGHVQQVHAAVVVVINHEKQDLQVMSCPLQERGSARDVHTPSIMVSYADGSDLLRAVRENKDLEGNALE